jgi:hypothetical protein
MEQVKTQVLVDSYSTEWVHYSFNSSFLGNQKEVTARFIGVESSLAYREYQGAKESSSRTTLPLVWQIIRAAWASRTRDVVFLAMTSREVAPVLLLRLFGFRVEYVMHKLNLRCRILRPHWQVIFGLLDRMGVKALCFELPHPSFPKYRLINFSPYAFTNVRALTVLARPFGRIAFIGRPDEGKEYEMIEAIAGELGFEVIVFTDEALPAKYKTKPHSYRIDDCDVIWGYYDPEHYQGIQSGLPYVALESGLKIITNNNVGFGIFSKIFSDYCISCNDRGEVKSVLSGIKTFSVFPNE